MDAYNDLEGKVIYMYLKTAMQIALVFFATVGVWCAMRGLLDKLTGAKEHTVAIEILTQRDAESAEVLIRTALFQSE